MKIKLRTSSSIEPYRKRAELAWGLEKYEYRTDGPEVPVVFLGLYHKGDYESFRRPRVKRYVFWCGGDILNLKRRYLFSDGTSLWKSKLFSFIPWHWFIRRVKAEHFVENKIEQKELAKLGIKAKIRPAFLDNVKKFRISFKPRKKPNVFVSGWSGNKEAYGIDYVINNLAFKCPDVKFHIYGTDWGTTVPKNVFLHGHIPEKQFNNEIKKYQCALRLNEHDGFSDITAKSILMGQYPITRIKYPKIDNYKTEEEIIRLLQKLKDKTKPNIKARKFWVKNLNRFPWVIN